MLWPAPPLRALLVATLGLVTAAIGGVDEAWAQFGPPAVGVVKAKRVPVTESDEFVGRVQAVGRVALVARVTAFLEQRLFTEGSEVKRGDLLYRLEQPPFAADVQAKQAAVAQQNALLANATITFTRAQSLLNTPAGQRSTVDDATASQRSQAAQLLAAQAALVQSQINYSYTEIRAPIDGKISSTDVTEGNVVSPSTGTLAMIVSQDPMYVLFPVSTREALDLRQRYRSYKAIVAKIRLENGEMYGQDGSVDYTSPTVATSTDTLTLRAVFANPVRAGATAGQPGARELFDGEFVTVLMQGVAPITVLGVPRAAVLSDQGGDYVYTLDADNKAVRTPVTLGQSTASTAAVVTGLQDGETVIAEGMQRVHPGIKVVPGPASAPPQSLAPQSSAPQSLAPMTVGAGQTSAAAAPSSGAAAPAPGSPAAAGPGVSAAAGSTSGAAGATSLGAAATGSAASPSAGH